jgi:magnesium chelatase accessory protein
MQQQRLVWERDGRQWPHRDASSFAEVAGLRWHLQSMAPASAAAPTLWLLHGTGASTHSWRGLMPLLARHFRVVAIDLPGHGFTGMPAAVNGDGPMSLPGMGRAVAALMRAHGSLPDIVVAHSAGVALAVRMCIDGLIAPRCIVGINGALMPLGGLAGQFFAPVAKVMAAAPFIPRLFAWRASDPQVLRRLIDGTGSVLDPTGMALYAQLIRNPGHAAGALAMMANWDLPGLLQALPRLATPLALVVGSNDRTVPPKQAAEIIARLPKHPLTRVTRLDALGHLAHEERPELLEAIVRALATEAGVLAP